MARSTVMEINECSSTTRRIRTLEEQRALEHMLARRRTRRTERAKGHRRVHNRFVFVQPPATDGECGRTLDEDQMEQDLRLAEAVLLITKPGTSKHLEAVLMKALVTRERSMRFTFTHDGDIHGNERKNYGGQAAAYEAAEQDPALVEVRAAIRAHPQLDDIFKRVLLLTTQIPKGRWSDYRTMLHHMREVGDFGNAPLSEETIGIYLFRNPFPGRVPSHRVVSSWNVGATPCRNRTETRVLLESEEVQIGADGRPRGDPFQFVGDPAVSLGFDAGNAEKGERVKIMRPKSFYFTNCRM